MQVALWVTEKVIERGGVISWNTKEDTGHSIDRIGVFEPFLNHHMVFLDDRRANQPLCIVSQLRIWVRRVCWIWPFSSTDPSVVIPCVKLRLRTAACEAACIRQLSGWRSCYRRHDEYKAGLVVDGVCLSARSETEGSLLLSEFV
jgi:hypothetical protein